MKKIVYSRDGLSRRQKLKARWRALWTVANHAVDIAEREGVTRHDALDIAAEQQKRKVERMRNEGS